MLLLSLARTGWRAVLAVLPAPLLKRLDDWARRKARLRAERRRGRLAQARKARTATP